MFLFKNTVKNVSCFAVNVKNNTDKFRSLGYLEKLLLHIKGPVILHVDNTRQRTIEHFIELFFLFPAHHVFANEAQHLPSKQNKKP